MTLSSIIDIELADKDTAPLGKESINGNEFTTYETLREEFVRPEEQTSIFDDNVDDILEMNAAIAMLTKTNMADPLRTETEAFREGKQDPQLDQEELALNTGDVLVKLNEQQADNVLYDSDGNVLEMYESDDESVELEVQKQPTNNEMELPIRLGYLNMNRYLLENGLTTNVITEQNAKEEQSLEGSRKSEEPSINKLKVDRVVDPSTHRFSQEITLRNIEDLDSDDDILEVVELNQIKRPKLPARVSKHQELLRLAQDQAKKRRKEDQDYIVYRISEQKRKKQLRKEAKLAKEFEQKAQTETEQSLKQQLKEVTDDVPVDTMDCPNQPLSQADINNLLTEEIDSNQEAEVEASEQHSEEDFSMRELPSSQGAFRKSGEEEDNLCKGILDELNSQSEDLGSESDVRSLDVVSVGQSHTFADTCISEEEEESDYLESANDQPAVLPTKAFKTNYQQSHTSNEADDMLNLLSGQFIIPNENQVDEQFIIPNENQVDEQFKTVDPALWTKQIGTSELDSGQLAHREVLCDLPGSHEAVADNRLIENIIKVSSSKADEIEDAQNSNVSLNHSHSETGLSNNIGSSDDDEASESAPQTSEFIRNVNEALMKKDSSKNVQKITKAQAPVFKTAFVEEEADVEEDEFMNFGGIDGEIDERLDGYDPEFVAEADKEVVEDYDDVIELHRKQMQSKHETDVSKLLHDVTTGNLRKRAQRGSIGKGFDTDSDEENDLLLRKIRKKATPAFMLDDVDDADMTNLQKLGKFIDIKKLAADPRSLAFAKCFVRDEIDDEGCISSEDESLPGHVELEDTKENNSRESKNAETLRSEDYESENENSFVIHKRHRNKLASKLTLSDEEESGHSFKENLVQSINTEDLHDPEFYHTTLSSERLGLDIFGIVKERRQRAQNSKRNKVQTSELSKYASKRTIESTRISQKQSFAMFAKTEASKGNRTLMSKEIDPKSQNKTFQAFQIGPSNGVDARVGELKPIKAANKKDQGQPNLKLVSLLTRKM